MKLLKRKFVKNIFVCILAFVLAASAPISGVLKVQASAALPAAVEGSEEALMALLDILLTAMAAGGAAEYVADYDDDMNLLESFMKFAGSMSLAGTPPGQIEYELEDGTTATLDDLMTGVKDGVIRLPNEQQWGKYRVGFNDDFIKILELMDKLNPELGGGSKPEPEPEPEEKGPKFDKLKALIIGSGVVGSISAFVLALKNGEVEGLAPETYFTVDEEGFNDTDVSTQSSGLSYNVHFSGFDPAATHGCKLGINCGGTLCFDTSIRGRSAVFFDMNSSSYGGTHFATLYFDNGNSVVTGSSYIEHLCGAVTNVRRTIFVLSCNTNVPVFLDRETLINYLKTGKGYKEAINYKPTLYNYPDLANSLSNSLGAWTNSRLSPATLQKTYAGIKSAYETEIKPNVDAEKDTETNTKTYVETVTKVVNESIVKPETDTETGTKPGTETKPDSGTTTPGTGTGTGTDTDVDPETDIENYKVDLRNVFPFCIPFDFIALLNALDADPVAPCFSFPVVIPALDYEEIVKLDMAVFDDAAEVMRTCEKVSFIILLMFATSKVIRW